MKLTNATRRNALDKLAVLSAASTNHVHHAEDITRLCMLTKSKGGKTTINAIDGSTARVPMGMRELEVLLALCKAAPVVKSFHEAEQLLNQLIPYLLEVHRQAIAPSPFLRDFQPWESLAYDLTSAVLALGLKHAKLRDASLACIHRTVESLSAAATETFAAQRELNGVSTESFEVNPAQIAQLAVTFLGLIHGCSRYASIWTIEARISLIQGVRKALSESFMIALERALSAIRNERHQSRALKEWKRWLRQYATAGRPLGAMLLQQAFIKLVEASTMPLITVSPPHDGVAHLTNLLMRETLVDSSAARADETTIETLTDIAADEMNLLDADADYLQVSSAWQQRLALEVKASSLRTFLYCSLLNEDIADADVLLSWLEIVTGDPVQLADSDLAQTVLMSMAVLACTSPAIASSLSRSLPRLIVQGRMTSLTANLAADCLTRILQLLSQDVVISTLYSLGNVLSATGNDKIATSSPFFDGTVSVSQPAGAYSQHSIGSAISLVTSDEEETATVYISMVQTIVRIATSTRDAKITALVISMLVQKIGRISLSVDAKIVTETAALGLYGGPHDLRPLLRLYARLGEDALVQNNSTLLRAVMDARIRLAAGIDKTSPLYEVYLLHLLGLIVSSGDTSAASASHLPDKALASRVIAQLLRPAAVLVSSEPEEVANFEDAETVATLGRDAWFNIVIHGITLSSAAGIEHAEELQVLAQYSMPLVDESRAHMSESGIDLNTVLRRGQSGQHAMDQKSQLVAAHPSSEADIRSLSYAESVFLSSALLVLTLRARSGDCTGVLPYFLENKLRNSPLGNCMVAVAVHSVEVYLKRVLAGTELGFAAPHVAMQLRVLFEGCCHRIAKVQHVATTCADRMINDVPSALCQRSSLFALLELLSLMWQSCLEAEIDEYQWKSTYTSTRAGVSIQLSDDVVFRQATLSNFHKRCSAWVGRVINIAPLDMKGLLQAYLAENTEDEVYGHISLGRSFAVEMGSMIPPSDQRLAVIDRPGHLGMNVASDFIAQYKVQHDCREEGHDTEKHYMDANGHRENGLHERDPWHSAELTHLNELARAVQSRANVPFEEVRYRLHHAAGSLSHDHRQANAIIHQLVAIPIALLTKQSVKLGMSLWMAVIKESPEYESRLLTEVALGWEASVRRQQGFFNPAFQHPDPFYVKEEFAPSDWEALAKRQQVTLNLLAPHLRLLQFLASHFSATRLTSHSIEQVYTRIARVTFPAIQKATTQPLARELYFSMVLFGLQLLKSCIRLDVAAQWRMKDEVLSAGLALFRTAPRWSYGSNRLLVKADIRLIVDVTQALSSVSVIGARPIGAMHHLQSKQELLQQLLSSESSRLSVWLSPLSRESSSRILSFGSQSSGLNEGTLSALLKTAWAEDPHLAVQLANRFSSPRLLQEIRWQLLNFPNLAIGEPEALHILYGSTLPDDVKVQLKYLLYWAPVNPMAAVTYFLPAYGNHPFIIQYAMRALESHSVDVTFFFVPQIVQGLRYDVLGYIERYIVETAKFSKLFAHQIIWNIKANAYKDEESGEPDPMKPTLDKVMETLVSSFSDADRDFYEREFDFFGKVTGISGKLKPFIKRPKSEKKQKIEEELRQIQVEVGVYLPSNPDGIIIGIDRKSGKPLQSHAKAPFMATFRIRKEKSDMEAVDAQLDRVAEKERPKEENTYELWQSAIFKVGDDCRQDVLALQLIAAFRGIFNNVGLDVYVYPYRVTATAPGCGVIDVLPNSVSRDMLGREAVNGLYEYFVSKYGDEDSIRFQEARSNFVKSMAAYSVISYLLQFKDRHNGNIMVDDAGHILHIDFGFCFDIVPGGVKFERAPFKLTGEMLAVMGGSTESQPFLAFEELCVKAFLASRPYAEKLAHMVLVMMDSGLPCFKPTTIQHLRERFVLEKSEREAAEFMRMLVHRSERSYSTMGYDQFQLMTNGIPY